MMRIQTIMPCNIMLLLAFMMFFSFDCISQGYNHNWLLGYTTGVDTNVSSKRGMLKFDLSNVQVMQDSFKMAFSAAQANISNSNGDLMFVTNGCWIADASMDTMMNGSGLNPNSFTSSWCNSISGIPYAQTSIVLPFPDDSAKYVLFHQTGNNSLNFMSGELYYSIIDMNLNGGLGAVTQKNVYAIQDTLNPGITACKHANGRDWWIVILKDSTDIVYKFLLTPTGISNVSTQSLGLTPHNHFNCQLVFSPNGNKFAYHYRYGNILQTTHEIRIFDFDRCSGMFSNSNVVTLIDQYAGFGLAFSPNSKFLYFDTYLKIFQLNTDTTDIQASLILVAQNDTFYSPMQPFLADFWYMYLAANGKIYISSGNSVVDMHYINYPDSSGIGCDVRLHDLHLPCWNGSGNVNHPNYYLGAADGTICDSLGLNSLNENSYLENFYKLYPNPTNGTFSVSYSLPSNSTGTIEIFDLNGRIVFIKYLPQWTTQQAFILPSSIQSGVYYCVISAGNFNAGKKLVLIKN